MDVLARKLSTASACDDLHAYFHETATFAMEKGVAHKLYPKMKLERVLEHGPAALAAFVLQVAEMRESATQRFVAQHIRTGKPVLPADFNRMNDLNMVVENMLPPTYQGWPSFFDACWKLMKGLPVEAESPDITKEEFLSRYVKTSAKQAEEWEFIEQGSPLWLFVRRFRFSASIIGGVVGLSRFKTLKDIAVDKLYHKVRTNPAMCYGSAQEDVVADLFEVFMKSIIGSHGPHISHRGFVINPESGGECGVSPDGLVDAANAILEIKCRYGKNPKLYSETGYHRGNGFNNPIDYMCQIQFVMKLMGRNAAYFVVHLKDVTEVTFYTICEPFATVLVDLARRRYYRAFVPTAIKYKRGELPFGVVVPEEERAEEKEAEIDDPFNEAALLRSIQHDKEMEEARRVRAEGIFGHTPEERALLEVLREDSDDKPHKWRVILRNESVWKLGRVLETLSEDDRSMFLTSLSLLPHTLLMDSDASVHLLTSVLTGLHAMGARGFLSAVRSLELGPQPGIRESPLSPHTREVADRLMAMMQ